jgi:hypothetical protein
VEKEKETKIFLLTKEKVHGKKKKPRFFFSNRIQAKRKSEKKRNIHNV